MKVFKFGGASLKSAALIKRTAGIIKEASENRLLIVVSAMGGTTDALEQIIALAQAGKSVLDALQKMQSYHQDIIEELFKSPEKVSAECKGIMQQIERNSKATADYDEVYDQVIGFGEILSSHIVGQYLREQGLAIHWLDARDYIRTDSCFREGKVNWEETERRIQTLPAVLDHEIIVTQGFIGATDAGLTCTLGREGSDFSAAIFGYALRAQSVTIWKDVPGVMSADPARLPEATVFDELPYQEAAEMTYFGASVIHPKTIKPLANRGIPLLVKSFSDPSLPGTIIHECHVENIPPLIVYKENQCLISCKVTDYTFISEEQLEIIFKALSETNTRINVMQNSAISFSFCIDFREQKVLKLIELLSKTFEVYYNTGLTLITVKNYDAKTSSELRSRKGVILEQSSRSTLQILLK